MVDTLFGEAGVLGVVVAESVLIGVGSFVPPCTAPCTDAYRDQSARYGDKIVMMVMDETHKLRHFYLTPQVNLEQGGTNKQSCGPFPILQSPPLLLAHPSLPCTHKHRRHACIMHQ